VLIDVQKGFDDCHHFGANRNNPEAEKNIERLLQSWRQVVLPVVHIKHMSTEAHSPLRPDSPGNDFKDEVAPRGGEHVVEKWVNSGFIGTDLEEHLKKHNIDTLVLVGLTTDHCVSTTTRMAGNVGFHAFIVADATATFDRQCDGKTYPAQIVHEVSLASLNNEFATVVNTNEILLLLKQLQAEKSVQLPG